MFRRFHLRKNNSAVIKCFASATAFRSFSVVGSETRELTPEEVKQLYSRPPNCVIDKSSSSSSSTNFASTGPLLDLSLVGVVKNTQMGPQDDQLPLIKCDIVSSWVSPSRGAVSDFLIDKQIFRVQIRGGKYARNSIFQENAIVYCHGRLILKPIFDSNNFRYQYFPELIVSDEYGWAECLMFEKVMKEGF